MNFDQMNYSVWCNLYTSVSNLALYKDSNLQSEKTIHFFIIEVWYLMYSILCGILSCVFNQEF